MIRFYNTITRRSTQNQKSYRANAARANVHAVGAAEYHAALRMCEPRLERVVLSHSKISGHHRRDNDDDDDHKTSHASQHTSALLCHRHTTNTKHTLFYYRPASAYKELIRLKWPVAGSSVWSHMAAMLWDEFTVMSCTHLKSFLTD